MGYLSGGGLGFIGACLELGLEVTTIYEFLGVVAQGYSGFVGYVIG